MERHLSILSKFGLIFYLLIVHLFAAIYVYENFWKSLLPKEVISENYITDPTEIALVPTPQPIPSIYPSETPPPELAQQPETSATSQNSDSLMIPVAGIKREQLQDTFTASRSEGRVHNAIDIIAPLGTPVLAIADGEIAKFFDSQRGGITIYQRSADQHFIYYYGHLQKRADNLREGDFVKQGTIIGYVGDTGNSGAGNYHLHFSISVPTDPQRIFDAEEINPFPLLKDALESQ
ncbi:MAG: peptidoglycan DD-metalloendopeptidase family protein [Acidobacteria bacterium]|nr:peptidoglycan DD-metalloendopeptidase family protein [Acidobacteriota bacterium]